MPRRLLSMRHLTERLDCSDDTVRRLVKRGLLAPPCQYRGLGLRWDETDVEEYLALERLRQRGMSVDEPTPPMKGLDPKPAPGEPEPETD